MKKILKLTVLMILVGTMIFISSCSEKKRNLELPQKTLSAEALIPLPQQLTATNSSFPLDQYTAIYTSGDEELENVGKFLANKINAQTGLDINVNPNSDNSVESVIKINIVEQFDIDNPEAYNLEIKEDSILLNAPTAEGIFRGVQTLRQLIPGQANDTLTDYNIWLIPTGIILDYPQFEFRSSMIDVARHFFSVDDLKKYIDVVSYYKMNYLHLHLTDDQGWRIEIKSWPKLTEIGGQTQVGGESGGYYTQEEYKDLVKYAAERYITIVPEIDMPGHTNAASLSYPFLNGNGKALKPYEGTNVGFSTFDTRKDSVYIFIDEVLKELVELTPGPYIHIGGDESLVTKEDDYKYFVTKVAGIVKKHGKKMIGWDEVVTADVDDNAVVQLWKSKENAKIGVDKGMKVILSPATKAYLDMKYDEESKYGLTWAAYIPVDISYNWSPEEHTGIAKDKILGIEGPLWSETISTIDELEYLAFPRVLSIAELGWTKKEHRNWDDYKNRLANQAQCLDKMEVKYYPSKQIDWKK